MRSFGLSVFALAALAPAGSASYPPPLIADGPPAPLGYSVTGYAQPTTLPPFVPPEMRPTGGAMTPGEMGLVPQPGALAWSAQPGGGVPGPDGFAFDPRYGSPRAGGVNLEYWARGDWLYWILRHTPVPALIATGDPNLPNPVIAGQGNFVPLGAGPRDFGIFNGGRVTVGRWFDEDGELGAELVGFALQRKGDTQVFTDATGTPLVSAPVRGLNGVNTSYDFASPGLFTGGLGVSTATQLFGAELSLLHRWRGSDEECFRINTQVGYRHLQLHEQVNLFGRSQATGGMATFNGAVLPPGVTVSTSDSFRGRTEFHGAIIGAQAAGFHNNLSLTAFAKVGAGINLQVMRVDGSTTATGPGATQTTFGGVRALPSNFGRDTNTDFSMVGEFGIELAYHLTRRISVRGGYNLLFWSDVLRPGNAIDPVVNFTQVPIDPTFGQSGGAARPVNVFRSSDFLAQGLVVGLQLDY
ncbi:MAG: BBP7 family outer membrane beta-barrel protein [Gemmata sp.]